MFKKIVTHGGGAHRDDFVAVALMIATEAPSAIVHRRDPTLEEMTDVNTAVIDVGGGADGVHCFDHHQLTKESTICSVTLVLGYLKLLELGRKVWKWLGATERLDTQGPFKSASHYGIKPELFLELMSPVEGWILRMFGDTTLIVPGDDFHRLLASFGKSLIKQLADMRVRLDLLKEVASIRTVKSLAVLDATKISRDQKPAFGLDEFLEGSDEVAVTITQDERGQGLCLFRRNDHPRVNFARLIGKPGVVFAHTGGFVVKTKADADVAKLLEEAIA